MSSTGTPLADTSAQCGCRGSDCPCDPCTRGDDGPECCEGCDCVEKACCSAPDCACDPCTCPPGCSGCCGLVAAMDLLAADVKGSCACGLACECTASGADCCCTARDKAEARADAAQKEAANVQDALERALEALEADKAGLKRAKDAQLQAESNMSKGAVDNDRLVNQIKVCTEVCNLLIEGVNKGQRGGVYTLEEASTLFTQIVRLKKELAPAPAPKA
jgi:hypothetical protein